jgi:hypothetical protein
MDVVLRRLLRRAEASCRSQKRLIWAEPTDFSMKTIRYIFDLEQFSRRNIIKGVQILIFAVKVAALP